MESAREARRRRIIERGSDRLAFITGEARSLPVTTPPKQEDPPTTAAPVCKDDDTGFELPEHPTGNEKVKSIVDNGNRVELSQKCETSSEFPELEMSNEAATNAPSGRNLEQLITSMAQRSSNQVVDTVPRIAPRMQHRIFTCKRISSSISATENIRLLCASIIALLVVLAYHDYFLGGQILRSIINFRPLFLVLLTDAAIVLGLLFVTQRRDEKDEEEARRTGQEEPCWANDISKILEAGMVFQKALNAAFMDCSICAVILIAGLVV